MNLFAELKDDQYPFEYIDHTRLIARAVVYNQEGKIALNKIHNKDIFGVRDYYELPGGGIQQGETTAQAVVREIREEVGYEAMVTHELGEVSDYYNLIHRHNRNFFFLAKANSFVGQTLEPDELIMIEKVVWVTIDEAINLYENTSDKLVSMLVRQRELPIIKMAKTILLGEPRGS